MSGIYNPDNPDYFNQDPGVAYPGGSATFNENFGAGNGSYNPNNIPSNEPTGSGTFWPNFSGPGVNQSGAGGFLQTVGQWLTGSNNPFTNAALIPAMAMAANQWNNADKYQDLGNQAAKIANPFGDRSQYVNELSALEKDPSEIANTPGYKFAMSQAMDSASSKLASQGFLGSTQMQNALTTEASGLAQQTYNNTINQLSRLAGADFNPANAASMMMRGGELSMDAKNAALAAMFYPFGPGAGNGQGGVTINNNNNSQGGGGGNGSGGGGGSGPGGYNPYVQGGFRGLPGDAASIMQRMISDPSSVTPGDLQLLQDLGIQTPFDTGGQDMAPGSYDTSGFGGYGSATDPTLSGIDFGNSNWSPFNYGDVMGGPYGDLSGYGDLPVDMGGFVTDPWGGG